MVERKSKIILSIESLILVILDPFYWLFVLAHSGLTVVSLEPIVVAMGRIASPHWVCFSRDFLYGLDLWSKAHKSTSSGQGW